MASVEYSPTAGFSQLGKVFFFEASINSSTRSTKHSVSGRGMRTHGATLKGKDQNSRFPKIYAMGSRDRRLRKMSALNSAISGDVSGRAASMMS